MEPLDQKETSLNLKAETKAEQVGQPVLKKFPKKIVERGTPLLFLGAFLVVLLGVGTGWLLSGRALFNRSKVGSSSSQTGNNVQEAGVSDESLFPDTAEGVLREGGIDGEGTHHLDRGLGPEKDVYLTSTVIDLQSFVGKKVEIWGQTVSGSKAGWLMDVGKIKVIE